MGDRLKSISVLKDSKVDPIISEVEVLSGFLQNKTKTKTMPSNIKIKQKPPLTTGNALQKEKTIYIQVFFFGIKKNKFY